MLRKHTKVGLPNVFITDPPVTVPLSGDIYYLFFRGRVALADMTRASTSGCLGVL